MHQLAIIIDDDPISILVCETMLKKREFAKEIKSFQSAEAGLKYLSAHYDGGKSIPDFIFLDVQMPVMDGWEFLERYAVMDILPMITPHVVMLSATFDPDDHIRAEEHPLVTSFLSKPITAEALENLTASKQ